MSDIPDASADSRTFLCPQALWARCGGHVPPDARRSAFVDLTRPQQDNRAAAGPRRTPALGGPMDFEAALCESISHICNVPPDRVSADATLADLGVDSLAAAEVIVDLEIRLGTELPIALLRPLSDVRTRGGVARALEVSVPVPRAGT